MTKRKLISTLLLLILTVCSLFAMTLTSHAAGDVKCEYGVKYVNTGSNIVYSLGEAIQTPYGEIPYRYSSTAQYPIAIFKDGAFLGATKDFSTASGGALEIARLSLTEHSRKAANVLVRKNIEISGISNNTGLLGAVIDVDLGGFTVTFSSANTAAMFNAQAKNEGAPATFIVRDGKIQLRHCPLIKSSAYSTESGGYKNATDTKFKEFIFTFSNIEFSFAKGSKTASLLAGYYDELAEGSENKRVRNTVEFNSCTFDLTNAKSGLTLFNANDTSPSASNTAKVISESDVKVVGCEFISPNNLGNYTLYAVNSLNGSSVSFDSEDSRSTFRVSPLPADKSGDTPGVFALFDMNSAKGGVTAQYVRIAIRSGATSAAGNFEGGLNTLELAVYGKAE